MTPEQALELGFLAGVAGGFTFSLIPVIYDVAALVARKIMKRERPQLIEVEHE